jgi:hypothetical protein
MNQYYISCIIMGQTPPKDLVMAKRQTTPKTCAIWHGMSPCMIWEQSLNNYVNPFVKSFGWKQYWRCSKIIPE